MECHCLSTVGVPHPSSSRTLNYQGISFIGCKLPTSSPYPLLLPSPLPNPFLQRKFEPVVSQKKLSFHSLRTYRGRILSEQERQGWDVGRFLTTLSFFDQLPSPAKVFAFLIEKLSGPSPSKVVKAMDTSGVVLVAGATGGVGRRVVDLLRKNGRPVRVLVWVKSTSEGPQSQKIRNLSRYRAVQASKVVGQAKLDERPHIFTSDIKDMAVNLITLVYHMGGKWVNVDSLAYIEGNEVVEKVDMDFLSFTHMVKKYRVEFGMPNVSKLCYLRPGMTLRDNGLITLENDDGINDIVAFVLELNVDATVHVYPIDENDVSLPHLGTQCSANLGMGSGSNLNGWEMGLGNDEIEVENLSVSDVYSYLEFEQENDGAERSDSDSESGYDSEGVNLTLIKQNNRVVKYGVSDDNPYFLLGMSFATPKEARIAISKYSLANCTPLKLKPNEKNRIRARCKSEGCPFELFMSQCGKNPNLVVKKFLSEHNCLKDARNRLANARFLANEFKDMINDKPNTSIKELLTTAEKQMHLYVSRTTCKRARRLVKNQLEGSYLHQFGYIGSYIDIIKTTNPGTTAELEFNEAAMKDGRVVFRRLYLCFDALKKGWKMGCRPIIGLDGCHLKGVVKGQVLVAVGKDAANQIFPIAWAVVDKENKENWTWFLELLMRDLEITQCGKSLTIISDMQKGLVYVVHDLLPLVEHRYCARHVYANWSKKWHSDELRMKFWVCVLITKLLAILLQLNRSIVIE